MQTSLSEESQMVGGLMPWLIFFSFVRMARILSWRCKLLRAICSAITTATKSPSPPTNTQKDVPRQTCTSIKTSPNKLSVMPTRQWPMVIMWRRLSFSPSPSLAPHTKYLTIRQMSQACTIDPRKSSRKVSAPMTSSSSKMDWQQRSAGRHSQLVSCGQDWQQ